MNIPKKEPIAIPIIFVPGIMGSRLAREDKMAWDPDNAGIKELVKSAKKRKKDLIGDKFDKDYLHVAGLQGSTIKADTDHWKKHRLDKYNELTLRGSHKRRATKPLSLSTAGQPYVKRGWGSVFWNSYGDLLHHLENFTRAITESSGNCHIYMPVYAHGYNWTASSDDSGKKLAGTIDDAILEMAGLGIPCKKVMIVTHSMGGFVARAASELHNKRSDIYGICHIAMPDNGSPATYKRMKAGFEGIGPVAKVIGNNGPDVTAVLGHAPGGLELLPNKHYKQADESMDCWLNLKDNKGNKENLYKVSAEEVYVEPNKWYRLVNPEWLSPENKVLGNQIFKEQYLRKSLILASKFHAKLGEKKHPNTWIVYGTGNRAWDKIDWELSSGTGLIPGANAKEIVSSSDFKETGTIKINFYNHEFSKLPAASVQIKSAAAKGDGTVHAGAGKYSSNVRKKIPLETSADHQDLMETTVIRNNIHDFVKTVLQDFASCTFDKEK